MEYEVLVQLKGEVLDPEARAIQETLKSQGIEGIADVTVAKRYVISLSKDAQSPDALIADIASRYLANPVAQTFKIKRLSP